MEMSLIGIRLFWNSLKSKDILLGLAEIRKKQQMLTFKMINDLNDLIIEIVGQ